MIIFIDESGDPGFKINRGSSRYFVLCFLIFNDEKEMEKTAERIIKYKEDQHISDRYEFKFNNLDRKGRCEFLKSIKDSDFSIVTLIVDKIPIVTSGRKSIQSLDYEYFLGFLLEKIKSNDGIYDLRIDGSMRKNIKNILKSRMRKHLPSQAKLGIQVLDSRNNILIQMADMISGCVFKKFTESNDSDIYVEIIKKHISGKYIL